MPRWITYLIVLIIGVAIGYAYMEIQSQQLIQRITATEALLSQSNAKATGLDEESDVLKAELDAKIQLIKEQTALIKSLEESLAQATSAQ